MHLQIPQTEKLLKSIMNEHWFLYHTSNYFKVESAVFVNIKRSSARL